MKILHVITTIGRGGAEGQLIELIGGQLARGHQVQVAYLWQPPYWQPRLESMGVQVHALGLRRHGDPRPIGRLRRALAGFAPDVVHAHMPPAEFYASLALAGHRQLPLLVTKHNDEVFFRGPGQRMVGRLIGRRSAHVIAISDAVKRYVTGHGLGLPESKVTTVRYGVDTSEYDAVDPQAVRAVRHAWGVADDELLIGTAARLVPQKALHVLLDGFARFLAATTTPARLVLVGAGPLEGELRAQAESLGIASRLIWAGFRVDMPVVMHAFDVFALTSIYEGFGLVLLEAMAAGRPVVASHVSAIPEIVRDGETGRLFPPLDADALADAFRAVEGAEARQAMGAAGRARVKSDFTAGTMIQRTMAIYENLDEPH